ncbi:MAG TPA: DUF2461 domain-containing protein [Bacteroidales bacterium]|jgi:uncharacterized protein (TIGR02453 family)|nr:DUF2461 domain-containing protein [Bacteroidales bacterium]
MINPELFRFLKELKKNNYKEWFDDKRTIYNSLRKEFEHFINLVISEIGQFDRHAAQTTASASIFRINRDIRFSNNKEPYKTNFGAFIARGGRKGLNAGYYIHVEPGECFLAGGIYMPSGPMLKAIRSEIFENIDEFRQIVNAKSFTRHFGSELWGDKLSSAPKGFPKDFDGLNYLKYKHYTIIKEEPDNIYIKPAFMKEIREVFQAMSGFNAFLNRAVEGVV